MTVQRVILEMAESYNVFSRCIYFNPEMTEKYQNNTDRYIKYDTNIIRQIDIFLQEDQLIHTKQGFPLVPAPSYLPNMYELGHSDVRQIDGIASTKVRRVENEMMVIMQEHQERKQHDVSHNSFCSSFSRIRSEELNNMGYGLSTISPITFDDDAFQTLSNRAKDRAPTLTPRKKRNEVNTGPIPTTQTPQQDGNARSYNADLLVAGNSSNELSSRFMPPQPNNTGSSPQEMDNSNKTKVYYGKSNGECQNKSTSIQTSPRNAVSAGTTTTTQTTNQKASQVGGTQTSPPPSPKKSTSTGVMQISPPKDKPHRQVGQGQPDCNQEGQPASATSSQGKKTKKSTAEAPAHPGPSTGPSAGPRKDFTSRTLGTGRPTIQCTACSEYSHWRRECLYDNYCTTCNNHNHATHMCRAHRQATNNQGQQGQQSPQICIYCGSIKHSSSNCCRRPWDNREQPHSTPESLRRDQQADFEFLGNAMGRTAPMCANSQGHPPQPQSQRSNSGTSANTGHNNRSSQYYRNYSYDYRESQKQPHTRFDERYNQRYSPPVFPPTPSLNS